MKFMVTPPFSDLRWRLPDLRATGSIGYSSSHRGVQENGPQHAVGISWSSEPKVVLFVFFCCCFFLNGEHKHQERMGHKWDKQSGKAKTCYPTWRKEILEENKRLYQRVMSCEAKPRPGENHMNHAMGLTAESWQEPHNLVILKQDGLIKWHGNKSNK